MRARPFDNRKFRTFGRQARVANEPPRFDRHHWPWNPPVISSPSAARNSTPCAPPAWRLSEQNLKSRAGWKTLVAAFSEGREIRAAGRITAHRDMGKSRFLDISDFSGRIQIFVHAREIGDAACIFKQLDIGDWVGVEGESFVTKDRRADDRVNTLHRSLQSLASAARQMARRAGRRNEIPPAVSRSDRESGTPRSLHADAAQLSRDRGGSSRSAAFCRSRNADDAGHRRRRGGAAVRRPITMRSAWTSTCASRRSSI